MRFLFFLYLLEEGEKKERKKRKKEKKKRENERRKKKEKEKRKRKKKKKKEYPSDGNIINNCSKTSQSTAKDHNAKKSMQNKPPRTKRIFHVTSTKDCQNCEKSPSKHHQRGVSFFFGDIFQVRCFTMWETNFYHSPPKVMTESSVSSLLIKIKIKR